jgi:hypothetical protein
MKRYINMLSSSKRVQSYEENFGVGAKVAAATRNHAGLIYLSWKDGVGSAIHLWRNPDTGQYGLRRFEHEDGSFSDWIRIEDSARPDQIKDHGTMVVLLGNDLDDNTMEAPKEAASPSRWVARYLNTRYFAFPKGITVKAREGWEYPRSNTRGRAGDIYALFAVDDGDPSARRAGRPCGKVSSGSEQNTHKR